MTDIGQFLRVLLFDRRSLSVGVTEDSASVDKTTEGSAECLAEGTFGRSLIYNVSEFDAQNTLATSSNPFSASLRCTM